MSGTKVENTKWIKKKKKSAVILILFHNTKRHAHSWGQNPKVDVDDTQGTLKTTSNVSERSFNSLTHGHKIQCC